MFRAYTAVGFNLDLMLPVPNQPRRGDVGALCRRTSTQMEDCASLFVCTEFNFYIFTFIMTL